MLDRIVENRIYQARDKFIDAIKPGDICRLASSYHDNDPCDFFKEPKRGSYNICFFTEIPIPRIQACSLSCDNPRAITQFMILEYVEGRTLSNLRRLEFPSISVLSCGPNGIDVYSKLISIGLNEQELEGLQPSCIQAKSRGRLMSASNYVSFLLDIAKNAFEKGRKSVYNEEDGNKTLYNLHQFSQFTKEKWLDHTLDNGPFVLAHGDLEPYNIIVNENMDIVALLDWEWSHLLALPSLYKRYELQIFNGELLLSNEWTGVHEDRGILVQAALDNWTEMDYFVARYLDQLLYKHKDLEGRIESFMKEDPTRRAIVERKTRDFTAYCVELKSLGITDAALPSDVNMDMPSTWKKIFSGFTLGRGSILLVAGASYLV
ncbi:hypothetical protein DL95DRAFT_490948 [Leptodontidium sp. 2 PMI_412]|nr:hypothetical protein DL95DRAFT_490948 [Leptodontidium sp. 2 PMI_412]